MQDDGHSAGIETSRNCVVSFSADDAGTGGSQTWFRSGRSNPGSCPRPDLSILRHRVKDYLADDLDRKYRRLRLEEDFLYAYGFMPLKTWRLLHPRAQRALTAVEQRVLDIVSRHKHLHPRDLEASLGKERETNSLGRLLESHDSQSAPAALPGSN